MAIVSMQSKGKLTLPANGRFPGGERFTDGWALLSKLPLAAIHGGPASSSGSSPDQAMGHPQVLSDRRTVVEVGTKSLAHWHESAKT
jgi:hypothetical protein